MNRTYDDIPRQGVDRTEPLDTEPTGNVRAQDPAHPPDRSKATRSVHVLLEDRSRSAYRLRAVPTDVAPDDDGFEEIDRVPAAGDVGRLYDRLPDAARHAVFEHTGTGSVHVQTDERLSGDWTHDEMFDLVTIFTEADDAKAFAAERREEASDE